MKPFSKMKIFPTLTAALLLLAPVVAQAALPAALPPAEDVLPAYVARQDPSTSWQQETPTAAGVSAQIKLTSQTWQGMKWTHQVRIFQPDQPVAPDTAILQVDYLASPTRGVAQGKASAAAGLAFVNVTDIPNEPLFGGLREGDLMAYTFDQYLKSCDAGTCDETWPLLLPMTKSIVTAMDAVTEYSRQNFKTPITKFIVMGMSKRALTPWLVAAVDKRVIGLAPMVYDNLNVNLQLPHQLEVWNGKYSDSLRSYAPYNLFDRIQNTPNGQRLATIIDAWTYRDKITVPKLLVMGTNDPFWALDAVNLYRKDLVGPVNYYYAPNAEHMLKKGHARTMAAIAGWARRVATGQKLPQVELHPAETLISTTAGARPFEITASEPVTNVKLWMTHSATQDFRQATWQSVGAVAGANGIYAAQSSAPPAGTQYSAVIGEVEVPKSGAATPLLLSTPVFVWKNEAKPAATE